MDSFLEIQVPDFIYEIVEKFWLEKKFNKQLLKLKSWVFDSWLSFEKIRTSKNIFFYSFRIGIHYRAYLRKEKWVFIIFDVNNHNYEKIKNKLKNI